MPSLMGKKDKDKGKSLWNFRILETKRRSLKFPEKKNKSQSKDLVSE